MKGLGLALEELSTVWETVTMDGLSVAMGGTCRGAAQSQGQLLPPPIQIAPPRLLVLMGKQLPPLEFWM